MNVTQTNARNLLLLGLTLTVACGNNNQEPPPMPPPPTVTVSNPEVRDIVEYATFTGTTEAIQSVDVRARVEGYLMTINFTPGATVEKDQVLFEIDPLPYQATLNEAKADMAIRQAEVELAEATLERNEAALKDNAVSEVAVIQARATRNTAKASLEAARARVENAELNLSYTKVRAPITGRVSRNLVDVGNLVGANERTVLTTLVNDTQIYTYFQASERELLRYRQQLADGLADARPTANLTLPETRKVYQGQIDYLDNRVDLETGTIQLRAVFDNKDHRLMPGLFGRLEIPVNNVKDALLVPVDAFGQDQQGHFLMLVDDQNMVNYRPVKAGTIIGEMRSVLSGLTAGDRVIINGLLKAQPGFPVNPVAPEASIRQAHAGAQE